jgi:hypothetical protein
MELAAFGVVQICDCHLVTDVSQCMLIPHCTAEVLGLYYLEVPYLSLHGNAQRLNLIELNWLLFGVYGAKQAARKDRAVTI